ncbi:hypothetical protein RF11_09818 [Thelohanellus kitauei]|uniref:Uncharacterized protein n=1 Tax=Thelohanellus kitauei TaxID=669202 RepID=A0A0C2NA40_THEKT|nr:hypothetical protein RF11_09818 [Thelohanellus kitauei]
MASLIQEVEAPISSQDQSGVVMKFLIHHQNKSKPQLESRGPLQEASGAQIKELSLLPFVIMEYKGVSYSGFILPQESIERKQGTTEDLYDYLFHDKKNSLQVYRDPKEKNSIRPRGAKAIRPCYAPIRRNTIRNKGDKKIDGRTRLGSTKRLQNLDPTKDILRTKGLQNHLKLLATNKNATKYKDCNFLNLGLVYSFYQSSSRESFMYLFIKTRNGIRIARTDFYRPFNQTTSKNTPIKSERNNDV